MYKTTLTLAMIWLLGNGAFAQQKQITEDEYGQLKTELEAIYDIDQGMRDTVSKLAKAKGPQHDDVKRYMGKTYGQDLKNLKKVETIVEKYGWLPKSKVGKKAAAALFYVIQHSKMDKMIKYLPLMKAMADKGESFPRAVALMEDRVLLHKHKKQRYGTQAWYRFKNGKQEFFVWPIEDVANVEKRRKKVGFKGTVEEYAKKNNFAYDPNEPLPPKQKKGGKKQKFIIKK